MQGLPGSAVRRKHAGWGSGALVPIPALGTSTGLVTLSQAHRLPLVPHGVRERRHIM